MYLHERLPDYLHENGYIKKVEDLEHNGEIIKASCLGSRITESFVIKFFGRVFNEPGSVFTSEMLRPEEQGIEDYVDGIKNITETQQRVAKNYIEDGSIDLAIPPLRDLLQIMANGKTDDGRDINDRSVRDGFKWENVQKESWYRDRLVAKAKKRCQALGHHVKSLESFLKKEHYEGEAKRLRLQERLEWTKAELTRMETGEQEYIDSIFGSIGLQAGLFD